MALWWAGQCLEVSPEAWAHYSLGSLFVTGGAVSLASLLFVLKHLSTEVHRLLDGSDALGANEPRC